MVQPMEGMGRSRSRACRLCWARPYHALSRHDIIMRDPWRALSFKERLVTEWISQRCGFANSHHRESVEKKSPPSDFQIFSWICERQRRMLEDKISWWIVIRYQTLQFCIPMDLEGEIRANLVTKRSLIRKGRILKLKEGSVRRRE